MEYFCHITANSLLSNKSLVNDVIDKNWLFFSYTCIQNIKMQNDAIFLETFCLFLSV